MSVDRIVPAISYRDFLEDLGATRLRIDAASREVSSGRRVRSLSDDPADIFKLYQYKDALAGFDQFIRNATHGKSLLSYTDSVMDSAVRLMNVVIERGTAGANGNQTPPSRRVIGTEITNLRDQILNLANSSFEGNYIFAGTRANTQPFVMNNGVVTYNGDSGVNRIDIGPGVAAPTNLPGDQVFAIPGNRLFDALGNLITSLQSPAPSPPGPDQGTQIANALKQVTQAFEPLRTARATVGSYLGAMERARQVLDGQRFQVSSSIGAIEDADLAESITNLVKEQTAENATLSLGARISRRTLFDFVG